MLAEDGGQGVVREESHCCEDRGEGCLRRMRAVGEGGWPRSGDGLVVGDLLVNEGGVLLTVDLVVVVVIVAEREKVVVQRDKKVTERVVALSQSECVRSLAHAVKLG